jgi:hypothetical protein
MAVLHAVAAHNAGVVAAKTLPRIDSALARSR